MAVQMGADRVVKAILFSLFVGLGVPLCADESTQNAHALIMSLSRVAGNGGARLLKIDSDLQPLRSEKIDVDFLSAWLRRNREAIEQVRRSPFSEPLSFGTATCLGNRLFLHVHKVSESNVIKIPRLHNSVRSLAVLGDPVPSGKIKNLWPEVRHWEIKLPQRDVGKLPIVVLELDDKPLVANPERLPVVLPTKDSQQVLLHARYAMPHGRMLRFEPQPHKNTVGYWVDQNDWVEWRFRPSQSRAYSVVMRYGCGDKDAGSQIRLEVIDSQTKVGQYLPFTVAGTGGFQNWRETEVGKIVLEKDVLYTLAVRPIKKAHNAVMDIQQISLIPLD